MATQVIMPQLGESVVEGTVTKWLKREHERIAEFEPLVEINTDKVDTEVPSPATGTVLQLLVAEGETVRAGTVLALIGEPGDELVESSAAPGTDGEFAASAVDEVRRPLPGAPAPRPMAQAAVPQSEVGFISPVVARIAAERGVDLSKVPGSGQGGRITKKDVLNYLEVMKPAPPWEEPASGELFRPTEEVLGEFKPAVTAPSMKVQPLDPVRARIAEHMVRSRHTSPHVTTVMEADLGRVLAHRAANRSAFEREGVNLTLTPYFVAATVEALKQVPIVNSSWSDQGIVLHPQVNVGVAVSLGDKGLIVPVVKSADQLALLALARSVNDVSERARNRKLDPDEVQGGTFTITNHGVSGSLLAMPIINQPQCAILGIGKLQKRVVVIEAPGPGGEPSDSLAVRPMVYLTLTFDHRIIDGAIADHFLAVVVQRLQTWA
ncbi:MAG: dihydrolipoamide acetyltransferase family protein [Anaerolineales bacterium]